MWFNNVDNLIRFTTSTLLFCLIGIINYFCILFFVCRVVKKTSYFPSRILTYFTFQILMYILFVHIDKDLVNMVWYKSNNVTDCQPSYRWESQHSDNLKLIFSENLMCVLKASRHYCNFCQAQRPNAKSQIFQSKDLDFG